MLHQSSFTNQLPPNDIFQQEDSTKNTSASNQSSEHRTTVDSLNINYQHVRGLRTKTKELYLSSCNSEYDIISLSETINQLVSSIFDNELTNNE